MRKLLILMAAALILIGAFALPASAVPVDDLTQLAAYFPEDTALFAVTRTDDDFVAQLDAVLVQISAVMPPDSLPVKSLSEALNMMAQEFDPEGDFAGVFRTWLGDTLAFGLTDASALGGRGGDAPPVIIAVEITDATLAEEYMMMTGALENYSRDEMEGYVLYAPMTRRAGQPFVIFRDDVLLISLEAGNVETGGLQDSPLSANDTFLATLAQLPAAEYNAVVYNNLPAILQGMADLDEVMEEMPRLFHELFAAVGPQAYGATILDGRSMTLDAVVTYADTSMLDAMGMSMVGREPVDPTFVRHIPAGTPLVIHANNAGFDYAVQIAVMRSLIEQMVDQGMGSQDDKQQAEAAIFAFETGIRGLTGLEPETAFGWMTGDVALYLGLTPRAADASSLFAIVSALPVDFAFTLEATDPAAAQALVDGLANGLKDLPVEEVTISREDIAGANALVVTVNTPDLPFPIELIMAANDEVFSLGTRRYVTFALAPGEGLDTDPAYQEAAANLLPNSSTVLYAAGAGLQPLARLAQMEDNSSSTRRDGEALGAVLGLISSASISVALDDTGTAATERLVWTLPE
ncbi:MAG: DUF3352 domain-containing protein [Anaerolineae bacterium]|nr:DUF3352 domain-containing protein [Anaerolineae bacterium]NUQ06521.1 DUF3352 domain-containing protein [Anaerolineae bacterium]